MTTPVLPVPELEPTAQRLLAALRPLLDDAQVERTRETAQDWLAGDAPQLQQRLKDFAGQEDSVGRSWLSREWLDGYLTVRTPLPLTTNVGFQITGDFGAPGLGRAAELVYRAAWVHRHGRQIVEGHTIDHVCKNRRCVNPEHLRSLPNFENARRTSGRDWPLGTCVRGHSNGELVFWGGKFVCRVCARERQRRYRAKLREQVATRG